MKQIPLWKINWIKKEGNMNPEILGEARVKLLMFFDPTNSLDVIICFSI